MLARADRALDRLIARYARQFFEQAPAKALDRRVGHSWQILGQGLLTFLANLVFLPIIFGALPIRFLTLLIFTPFRLIAERGKPRKYITAEQEERRKPELPTPPPGRWLTESVFRVTEQTTEHLASSGPAERGALPKNNPVE
jgi:hypothetical protein